MTEKSKYDRKITGLVLEESDIIKHNDGSITATITVDVYDVLKAFAVTCPALQHLNKKSLCAGLRGHKDITQDLQDILDSANRAIELNKMGK